VKDAGAVLLGITTIPNLGLSYACDDTACGGANNPHDTRRIPGNFLNTLLKFFI
jgi:Asp-tRNA(Asn)/Glu-tRNA(Gln) amidotransferase A subunit family amidase